MVQSPKGPHLENILGGVPTLKLVHTFPWAIDTSFRSSNVGVVDLLSTAVARREGHQLVAHLLPVRTRKKRPNMPKPRKQRRLME